LPEELFYGLQATNNPLLSAIGSIGAVEGEAIGLFKLIKSPQFRQTLQLSKAESGAVWRNVGNAFEDFLKATIFRGAQSQVPSGGHVIDLIWRNFAVEVKTARALEGREISQLESFAGLAVSNGMKLVYMFVDRPTQATIDLVKRAGGIVIWFD